MTKKLHWYRRYCENALAGMKVLTLEERGAYNTALDLIYLHGGALDDDDQFIAGWCSCDVRIWKRIKVRLLALGKLYLDGGKLRNGRADTEVADGLARVASATDAGIQSGVIRSAKSKDVFNPDNGLGRTTPRTETRTDGPTIIAPSPKHSLITSTTTVAARASASPDGPPRSRLPDSAKWSGRLDGYRPWEGIRVWQAAWGPRPDQPGNPNPLIPPEMLRAWREKRDASKPQEAA